MKCGKCDRRKAGIKDSQIPEHAKGCSTPLPSVEEVVKQFRTRWGRFYLQRDIGSTEEPIVDWKQGESTTIGSDDIEKYFTQDRNQAYTSLVEGIKAQVKDINGESSVFDDFATDIIEKVVKPLYGKK